MRSVALAAGIGLATGAGAAAQQAPSFDCARAESQAEKLVCGDAQLAELDRELARLYRLAVDGPQIDAERKRTLVATQRGWVKGRDDCWKADDPRTCVKADYVIGIADLRQGYPDARSDDAAGISIGPLVADCPGLDAPVATTFVNSDPGAVYLGWRDRVAVLDQTMSASGARYEATLADGYYLFWNKGDAAQFEAPGVDGTLTCQLSEPG